MKKNLVRHFYKTYYSKIHPKQTFRNHSQMQNLNRYQVKAQIVVVEEVLKVDRLKLRELIQKQKESKQRFSHLKKGKCMIGK